MLTKRFPAAGRFPREVPSDGMRADKEGWLGLQLKVFVCDDGTVGSSLYRPDSIEVDTSRLLTKLLQHAENVFGKPDGIPVERAVCLDVGINLSGDDTWGPGWQFSADPDEGFASSDLAVAALEDMRLRLNE